MIYIENPKLVGSNIAGCFPQGTPCPIGCNQCYANRPGASYAPMDQPNVPTPEEVGNRIVRINDLGDSNVERDLVFETAKQYKDVFFNTSQPDIDFPGPVVLTMNPEENNINTWAHPEFLRPSVSRSFVHLMALRVRVTPANIYHLRDALSVWRTRGVAILLMHMRYYDRRALIHMIERSCADTISIKNYTRSVHVKNSCYQPSPALKAKLNGMLAVGQHPNTYLCDTKHCRDCRQCEHLYWLTKRRMGL